MGSKNSSEQKKDSHDDNSSGIHIIELHSRTMSYGFWSVFVIAAILLIAWLVYKKCIRRQYPVLTDPVLTGGQNMGWWGNVGPGVYANMQRAYAGAQIQGAQVANAIIAQLNAQMPQMPSVPSALSVPATEVQRQVREYMARFYNAQPRVSDNPPDVGRPV